MRSSSPVDSSPSKTPFTSSASRRYVSKVYSRRPTLGSSAVKRARRADTPDSDDAAGTSDTDGAEELEEEEPEQEEPLERSKGTMTAREKENIRRRDGLLASPERKRPAPSGISAKGGGSSWSKQNGTELRVKGTPLTYGGRTNGASSSSHTNIRDITKRSAVSHGNGRSLIETQRTETEISISSAPSLDTRSAASLTVPPITVQAATSSPSVLSSSQSHLQAVAGPSTPPRKSTKRPRPKTPTSSPRDISSLFAPVSPAKSPHRLLRTMSGESQSSSGAGVDNKKLGGKGLFKRMLDKSQSLGGLTSLGKSTTAAEEGDTTDYFGAYVRSGSDTPSKQHLARTQSLPSTPSKSPMKGKETEKEETTIQASSLIVPLASSSRLDTSGSGSDGNRKRTYGRSRTMLAETAVNDSPRSGASSAGEKDVVKESYAELRKQFEVDNTGGDESGEGNLMTDLLAVRAGQSVSDLRSKGENRRFMDELGYLVDPIMDPSTSMGLKRSSIFDILRSMQDEVWLQRAKICGQVERIWEAIYDARGEAGDELIEAMSLLYLTNLIQSGSGLELVLRSHDESCAKLVLGSLKVKDGPLDQHTRAKITGLAIKVRNMYQQLSIPWSTSDLSTRRLTSYLLVEMTAPLLWSSAAAALSSERALQRIAKILSTEVADLAARFDLVETGLDLIPEANSPDIDHIAQCLTVLGRLINNEVDDRQALVGTHESMAPVILNAMIAGVHLVSSDIAALAGIGYTMTTESLQVLAAMTTASTQWCQAIPIVGGSLSALARILLHRSTISAAMPRQSLHQAEDDDPFLSPQKKTRIPSPEHGRASAEDLLCMVLAILTTSIPNSPGLPAALGDLRINATCKGSKSCLRTCSCSGGQPIALHLVEVYLEYKRSEAATASLIAAYLALLLSQLLVASQTSRKVIQAALPPEGHGNLGKVEALIEVLSDLGGLQTLVHDRLRHTAQVRGIGQEGAFIDRVGEEEGVVQGVIEGLREVMAELSE